MFLFDKNPMDAEVQKATSSDKTNDDWSLILKICDTVNSNPSSSKNCLNAIIKQMGHPDPHVVMHAITLLDACVNNCGRPFHLVIASRDFEKEFIRLLAKAEPKVSQKLLATLKSWADNDFKEDPQLQLIPLLFDKLVSEGKAFNDVIEKASESSNKLSKDTNVASNQKEEDDLAKAIELSLLESKNSPKHQSASTAVSSGATSLYPSFSGSNPTTMASLLAGGPNNQQEGRKVRALYDFEAAEENELTFLAGEIIHVVDDSDPNWWKGYNKRGDGLFPSNFVTADLSIDPERLDANKGNKKNKQNEETEENVPKKHSQAPQQQTEIDEQKIDRLLHLLQEANPEDSSQDSDEMLQLEQEVHQMGPLIDNELQRVECKYAKLTQLSSEIMEAVSLYHSVMAGNLNCINSGYSAINCMPCYPYSSPCPPNSRMFYGNGGYPGSGPQNFVPGDMNSMPFNPVLGPNPQPAANLSGNGVHGGPYPIGPDMAIPMQYQNGHGAQLNGMPPSQPIYNGPLPQQVNHQPQPFAMMPQPQSIQQFGPQSQPPNTTSAPEQSTSIPIHTNVPNQPQFMSPQHQGTPMATGYITHPQLPQHSVHSQQPPVPFTQVSNGPQQNNPPQGPPPPSQHPQLQQPQPQQQQQHSQHPQYINQGAIGGMNPSMMPPSIPTDQYSQLQHQMTNMQLAPSHPNQQPIPPNFLVQNEPKSNILIYQQQR